MTSLNTQNSYGILSKLLHWGIVALLLVMLLGGIGLSEGYEFAQQAPHEVIGKIILGLAVLRLILRIVGAHPQPHPNHTKWEIRLSRLIHWGFYAILFVFPISGWIMVSAGDYSITGSLPSWIAPDYWADSANNVHHAMKLILIGFVVLHISGALKHAFLDRDGTLKRMWFGKP